MSKKTGPPRIKLSDYKERKGVEGSIVVELDDGPDFVIPPPELWPDEFTKRMRDDTFREDAEAQARLIVGDVEFDRFTAAGGTAMLFHSLVKDHHGADAGESLPSPSS